MNVARVNTNPASADHIYFLDSHIDLKKVHRRKETKKGNTPLTYRDMENIACLKSGIVNKSE